MKTLAITMAAMSAILGGASLWALPPVSDGEIRPGGPDASCLRTGPDVYGFRDATNLYAAYVEDRGSRGWLAKLLGLDTEPDSRSLVAMSWPDPGGPRRPHAGRAAYEHQNPGGAEW
jgi:hypothetical protein